MNDHLFKILYLINHNIHRCYKIVFSVLINCSYKQHDEGWFEALRQFFPNIWGLATQTKLKTETRICRVKFFSFLCMAQPFRTNVGQKIP